MDLAGAGANKSGYTRQIQSYIYRNANIINIY